MAILGGAGITDAGVWNQNAFIVAVQRRMIAAAERSVFALDSSKFGRKALTWTTGFDRRFTIVTDAMPGREIAKAIEDGGAKIEIATKS